VGAGAVPEVGVTFAAAVKGEVSSFMLVAVGCGTMTVVAVACGLLVAEVVVDNVAAAVGCLTTVPEGGAGLAALV